MIKPSTVSEIIGQIKGSLESSFKSIYIQGEVSNLSKTIAGHYYFTLSDRDSSLSCALFKGDALRNPLVKNLKNGDEIIVSGSISVYAKRGIFQLLAKRIVPAGSGKLQLEFEKLKSMLGSQGYFDLSSKKSIPAFPKKIAVITAPYGAALQDFLNIIKRRMLWCEIVIIPAVVQGNESEGSLIMALQKAQEINGVETIVLTRGGGSIEDLWSFNSEALVYEIAACEIPIISAIGHQVDFTLSDYASDLRCETPSAAAEHLSQSHTHINMRIEANIHKLSSLGLNLHSILDKKLKRYNPHRLVSLLQAQLKAKDDQLRTLKPDLLLLELKNKYDKKEYINSLLSRASKSLKTKEKESIIRLKTFESQLRAINPTNVLGRGFSLIRKNGELITSSQKLQSGDLISIELKDGKEKAKIYDK